MPDGMTQNDLSAFWMPFTANRRFKKDPRILVSAEGMYYKSHDNRDILDGTAGLWCVNAGHARPKIVEAVQKQVAELDFAPTFQFGHPKAFELASRLRDMFPGDLDHVFFTNSGSESADTALKIALAYQRARGQGTRTRLIGRERGYHGTGFGGITVGGIVKNRMYFGSLLAGADHIRHTHDLEHNAFTKGEPEYGAHFADDLEKLVTLHDASTIAAVIVEPMAGSTGVLLPPKGYLKRLREICDKHGILLIFDEVITAFGRLGFATAAERLGVVPDILTCAKGLTNAVIPMGAVAVRKEIYDTMLDKADAPIELFHGYTYSGHPVAAAAGLASLETYKEEGLFENALALEPYLADAIHSLKGHPNVVDIRNMGLVAAVELSARPGAPGERGYDIMVKAYEKGAMVRVTGDIIAMSPPLICEKKHIDDLVGILGDVLKEVA
ncbi:MAG: aspartate aminotransferase family protein [Alphaproteobacteria bacterium]|jgi:beta-alanine--pyruvate transaminase|uniref:aspartate aminotransferase family protein n=1 Tax=Pacificispira sp. TaxID=2888761 RepID=UPI001B2EDE7B|nr:aspartate aminotransferase family protein [Alphaproteobacteria bacterium]MBO6863471.1 aspartate aminotransferase family protein [Alphaproteobacteria bacterium]MEC9268119.1 aspartate aminotransferase family protein [Pseudomonadota bacterium]